MSENSNSTRKKVKRIRILLVDDHPMVRERLTEVINREPDLVVCAEAEDRSEAIETIKARQPKLVIVDLTLRNSDGVELIKDIHSRWPGLLMLVVSMHDESLYAERVLRAGARGYITKQEATRSILCAIRRVLDGQIFLSEPVASQILSRLANAGPNQAAEPIDSLAERELQVFELTGRGLNTRQIASQLHIGVKTVETYRHRICEKLKLDHPRELLRSAIAWTHQEQKQPHFL
ncbi:MAG TPA: response regulator transcription factor [Verrucomicrobiae bacterium]|nr:response regulator transcription factor [Verrucomicrobiae bacterium]